MQYWIDTADDSIIQVAVNMKWQPIQIFLKLRKLAIAFWHTHNQGTLSVSLVWALQLPSLSNLQATVNVSLLPLIFRPPPFGTPDSVLFSVQPIRSSLLCAPTESVCSHFIVFTTIIFLPPCYSFYSRGYSLGSTSLYHPYHSPFSFLAFIAALPCSHYCISLSVGF